MTSLLGCSGEDFASVLKSLGYFDRAPACWSPLPRCRSRLPIGVEASIAQVRRGSLQQRTSSLPWLPRMAEREWPSPAPPAEASPTPEMPPGRSPNRGRPAIRSGPMARRGAGWRSSAARSRSCCRAPISPPEPVYRAESRLRHGGPRHSGGSPNRPRQRLLRNRNRSRAGRAAVHRDLAPRPPPLQRSTPAPAPSRRRRRRSEARTAAQRQLPPGRWRRPRRRSCRPPARDRRSPVRTPGPAARNATIVPVARAATSRSAPRRQPAWRGRADRRQERQPPSRARRPRSPARGQQPTRTPAAAKRPPPRPATAASRRWIPISPFAALAAAQGRRLEGKEAE